MIRKSAPSAALALAAILLAGAVVGRAIGGDQASLRDGGAADGVFTAG